MRKFLTSALMGTLALLAVNLTSFLTGVALSVNYLSLLISSFLGVAGVITMLVLAYIIN